MSRYLGSVECLALVFLPSRDAIIVSVLTVGIVMGSKIIQKSKTQVLKEKESEKNILFREIV